MEKQRARSNEEKEYRRRIILASSKKLFSTHGYQGTTIGMITNDADLSPAAFYLYFKNKIDVYRALSIEGTDILQSMILDALGKGPFSSQQKIIAVAEAYFNFFTREREYYDIITVLHLGQQEFFSNQNMVPFLEDQASSLLKLLAGIIDDGIASGEFREMDSWKTAAALWGMMDGILLMEIKESTGFIGVTINELSAKMLEIVIAGLSKD